MVTAARRVQFSGRGGRETKVRDYIAGESQIHLILGSVPGCIKRALKWYGRCRKHTYPVLISAQSTGHLRE